jgi:MFS family permease
MQTTIVSYMLYQLTHDKLSLGLLGLAEVVPAISFSLVSGHFVDRREKKSLLAACLTGYTLLALFYLVISLGSVQQLAGIKWTTWLIYGGTFIGGALRSFVSPASFALLGGIIPRRLYAGASTWSSSAWQLGAVLGPILGGFLIAISGYSLSFAVVAFFSLLSVLIVLRLQKQPVKEVHNEPVWTSIKEGLNLVFKTELILAALALDLFAVFFGGAVALLPVYAADILHVDEVGYGWLRAAPGIGSIFTLLLLAVLPLRHNPGIKLLLSIAGFGITTIVFGISTSFVLSLAMLFLGGAFDAVSVVIRGTVLQLFTPANMRGRVAAVNTMFISSSNEIGALESGATAKWMGTVPAVVFGGCMTIVVVIITYFKSPALRTLQLDGKGAPKEKEG